MSEPGSASQPLNKKDGAAILSDDNLETLQYLHRAIELADGFALFFARCDWPVQRDELIARLEERLARQGRAARRLDVVPPATGLLVGLRTACRVSSGSVPPACVHVCGLEDALLPQVVHPPVLQQLNLARERFRDLPCPLVFWLPDPALTDLAQGAPDFWAWRSGTFDFALQWVPQAYPESLEVALPADVILSASLRLSGSLPSAAVRAEERIRALENLLIEYDDLGDGPIEQRARAGLLLHLADLYRATERPQAARRRLRRAMPLIRRLEDKALESRVQDLLRAIDAASKGAENL